MSYQETQIVVYRTGDRELFPVINTTTITSGVWSDLNLQ